MTGNGTATGNAPDPIATLRERGRLPKEVEALHLDDPEWSASVLAAVRALAAALVDDDQTLTAAYMKGCADERDRHRQHIADLKAIIVRQEEELDELKADLLAAAGTLRRLEVVTE